MKKLILLLLFIPLVFQGCFSYKTVKYSQISNDKKQKIIIETIYKENIKGKSLSENEIINWMIKEPKLMERPILVNKNLAEIGRPKENFLKIIN